MSDVLSSMHSPDMMGRCFKCGQIVNFSDLLGCTAEPYKSPREVELERDLAAAQGEVERLKAQIGTPPEGSHPDERLPRAQTWHQERMNWIDEVSWLRLFSESERQAKVERGDMLCECEEKLAALREDRELIDHAETYALSISRLTAPDMSGIRYVGQFRNPAKERGEAGLSYVKYSAVSLRELLNAARKEAK